MSKLVNTYVDSDCCLILSYPASGGAVYLYDNLADRRELLFSQYLNGIYAQDPFYRALRHGLSDGVYSLQTLKQEQGINDLDYSEGFYQATGWQQELGLLLRLNEHQWLALFLGRFTTTAFSLDQQHQLSQLLPILSALCGQHWPKGTAALAQAPPSTRSEPPALDTSGSMRIRVEQALASFAEQRLTPREQTVARLLIQGHSNAVIAEQLAIGEGTVKNHRKHLYAKLAIDSQGALFARFLNHLITNGPSLKR